MAAKPFVRVIASEAKQSPQGEGIASLRSQ